MPPQSLPNWYRQSPFRQIVAARPRADWPVSLRGDGLACVVRSCGLQGFGGWVGVVENAPNPIGALYERDAVITMGAAAIIIRIGLRIFDEIGVLHQRAADLNKIKPFLHHTVNIRPSRHAADINDRTLHGGFYLAGGCEEIGGLIGIFFPHKGSHDFKQCFDKRVCLHGNHAFGGGFSPEEIHGVIAGCARAGDDAVNTRRVEGLGDFNALLISDAALNRIGHGYFAQYWKVRANGFAGCSEAIKRNPHAFFMAAAILVRAFICFGANELRQAVAMPKMDFQGVKADPLHKAGRVVIGLNKMLDIGVRHGWGDGPSHG